MILSIDQIKAAKAMLDWSNVELGKQAGVSTATVNNILNQKSPGNQGTLRKIRSAFENNGIEFQGMDSVKRNHSSALQQLSGYEGFRTLHFQILNFLEKGGENVYIFNVDEPQWDRWATPHREEYFERIGQIDHPFEFKILIAESDTNLIASSYADYKWMPKEAFGTSPFCVFGDKIAMLSLEGACNIVIAENEQMADSMRRLFTFIWSLSRTPDAHTDP